MSSLKPKKVEQWNSKIRSVGAVTRGCVNELGLLRALGWKAENSQRVRYDISAAGFPDDGGKVGGTR